MTQAKKLKKQIRARARKTGESYTAARRQVLRAREKRAAARPAALPEPPGGAHTKAADRGAAPPATLTRGAVSDSAIRKKTGHGLDHWFAVLDAFDPRAKGHTDRARYLQEHGVPGWHTQGIAVAYERSKGLRATNQACDGSFQVSVSRAVPAAVADIADAIGDPRRRAAWLRQTDAALAHAVNAAFAGEKPRSVRVKDAHNASVRIPWDGSTVEIRITGKPNGNSTVVADNKNLGRPSLVEERRAQWKVALDALKAQLTS